MDPDVARELIEKLGLATNEIVRIFSEVQPALGVVDLISGIFGVIIGAIFFKKGYVILKSKAGDDDLFVANLALVALLSLLAVILGDMFVHLIGDTIVRIAYPEYFAVKEILRLIG